MSRLEEVTNELEKNNDKGGNTRDEWILFFLAHINISLATIADCLSEKASRTGGGEQDETD